MGRVGVWRLVALAVACAAVLALAAPSASGADASRARAAYRDMERLYFDPRRSDYRKTVGGPVGSDAWSYSQALAATVALARVEPRSSPFARVVQSRLASLDRRFLSHTLYAAAPHGHVYYDDNEWIALDLLDWNALKPDRSAVDHAREIFAGVVSVWSSDASLTCPGGVPWTDAPTNQDRNTVTTANGAVLGLRLYLLFHRPFFLQWSTRMLAWLDQCLLAPDGLFWDHLVGGAVDETEWSYNQGSVMEAYRLLYLATGNAIDLTRAEAIANATLTAFDSRWLSTEPTEFAAIFFRRLIRLGTIDGNAAFLSAAQAYADQLQARPRIRLLDQAALVQLYAALAAPQHVAVARP